MNTCLQGFEQENTRDKIWRRALVPGENIAQLIPIYDIKDNFFELHKQFNLIYN